MKGSTLGRLQEVLDKIEDPTIKDILDDVFKVEISYRSTGKTNFPRQKIRDIIENVARLKELQSTRTTDETTSN